MLGITNKIVLNLHLIFFLKFIFIYIRDTVVEKKIKELEPAWPEEKDEVDEFIEYFDKNFVGAINGRTGIRNQPRFPHTLWNKHDAVINDEFLTTNSAEGYNYGLSSALPANSGTWTVVASLQAEEATANLKLRTALLGPQNNETTKSSARNTYTNMRRKELASIVEKYDEDVSTVIFMQTIVGYYNHDVINE